MSTEIVTWEEQMAAEAKAIADLYRPSLGRFSFKGGLSYGGVEVPGNKAEIIILGAIYERNYYSGIYNPDEMVNPDCFAFGEREKGTIPHENVPEPVAAACDVCPYDQFGSSDNKKSKRCKTYIRLIAIPADAAKTVDGIKSAAFGMAKLSYSSQAAWKSYMGKLSMAYGMPMWTMISEMQWKPDKKAQYLIDWTEKGTIKDPEMLSAIQVKMAQAKYLLAQPYDYTKEKEEPAAIPDAGKKKKY